jgi:hypothetical protein
VYEEQKTIIRKRDWKLTSLIQDEAQIQDLLFSSRRSQIRRDHIVTFAAGTNDGSQCRAGDQGCSIQSGPVIAAQASRTNVALQSSEMVMQRLTCGRRSQSRLAAHTGSRDCLHVAGEGARRGCHVDELMVISRSIGLVIS